MYFKINIFICVFIFLFNHVKMINLGKDFFKMNLRKIESFQCSLKTLVTNCSVYERNDKRLFFVKQNFDSDFKWIFNGEYEGLIEIILTNSVYVPRPVATGIVNDTSNNTYYFIATEYLKLNPISPAASAELGNLLADMHMNNLKNEQYTRYGFHVETWSGVVSQNNTWNRDWVTFFIENRMDLKMMRLQYSGRPSNEEKKTFAEYWCQLKPYVKRLFVNTKVFPSLLHGNLWRRHCAEVNSRPVLYNPAAFYGHHEYDIASTNFIGSYPKEFYEAYFKKIPKADGFENRQILYHLYFHFNNYWNSKGEVTLTPVRESFQKLLEII